MRSRTALLGLLLAAVWGCGEEVERGEAVIGALRNVLLGLQGQG